MILSDVGDARYNERIWQSHVADDFATDVVDGLRAAPKSIPSKYIYDAVGSALFEAIVLLPEYDLPRNELSILQKHAASIVGRLGEPLDLLELGSGSSLKTRVLIEATLERHGSTRYTAIDISVDAIRGAAAGLLERYPQLSMRALAGDYFQVLPNLRSLDAAASSHRTLALFLGSNIGNYRDKRACQLLGSLHDALRTGDLFLLGVDLRKDRATMERAYNDPTGITAAFSKNLLARVVRELGSSIDVGNFEHEARYDERTCSIESFLVARSSAEYSLGEGRPLVTFDADERIHIESSRKFQLDELSELAAACGFTEIQTLLDERERYAVVLWERL